MTYFDIVDVPLGFNHVARCIVSSYHSHAKVRCAPLVGARAHGGYASTTVAAVEGILVPLMRR